ncbi:MAG TPA: DNA repair protein RadC [Thermoclostridium caenicola]|uniref:RadC family protein n=1 Tax=Thermoclostridium caenicola TaxID=659425 RepID=UPI002B7AC0E5|nr:DNA repair protein RadC [Thermoclostridium caenicola]HOK43755.1 DNA repair protein RadC [Thermoclostridium caenicola]HOL84288.1 DNA repair protein RadC [Thermoclostridium caenicola]HPO76269.1 DNA repair protein RadC [Thermoclostridium caenicola]
MEKNIHAGHRERVRERFMEEGLDGFKDHEILELLLYYCVRQRDTNALAHRMLMEYGTLHDLLEAHPRDIARRCRVSLNTATLISLCVPLARRYMNRKWGERPVLNSSFKAGEYAMTLFAGRIYEAFFAICLDSQNRVNHAALVHEGTINEAPVYPRLIVETALRHKASSVILAHNHPGGSLKPSVADIEVTKKIYAALKSISINVVDHIIVAGQSYTSFAEQGLIESIAHQF